MSATVTWLALSASASALMCVVFVVAMRTRNLGIVDVVWAAIMGVAAWVSAALGAGATSARALVAIIGGVWSIRLFVHLARRFAAEDEDGRYQAMRVSLGDRTLAYFGFFQLQALSVALLAVPLVAAASNPTPTPLGLGLAGVVAVASVVGETVADRQLARYRADPSHRGTTCRDGLWAWSRHPNYFFEWLHWWCYPAIALGGEGLGPALAGPVLMGLFLFRVSGIPWVEAQALRSRGEDYRRYQREVSVFFPRPPRTS